MRLAFALTLALLALPASAATAAGDRVLGLWLTSEGDAQVRVERVGDLYQGTIIWLKEPRYPADDAEGMAGRDKVDRENPDERLQRRPIMGLQIVAGFRFDGELWRDGKIYDPESGKTYKCKMWFEGETLNLRGYIGFALLGRSTTWTRIREPQ